MKIERLDLALRAAGIPIDGVSSDGTVAYQASATPAQIAQGASIVASIDTSASADDTFLAQQAKTNALASIDLGALKTAATLDRLIRALSLVLLDEVNAIRTNAGLAQRTTTQLVNAIKAKISATAE